MKSSAATWIGPTIPWPPGIDQDVLVDGYGLMQHRHALWQIRTGNPQAVVQAFHKAYTDAGWRIDQGAIIENDELNSRYHFRAWDGAPHQVEVFEVRDGLDQPKAGETSLICVRYHHRFDRRETRETVGRLLEDDTDLPVLRYLQSQMDREQRAHYFQMLASSGPTDPRDYLALAEFHHREKQDEEAKDYLIRASLLAYRAHDKLSFQNKLKEAAKKIGFDEHVIDPSISPEPMAEFGYKHLDELVGKESVIDINQAVQIYFEKQGDLHTLDLWIAPDLETVRGVKLHHYERHGLGSTSWGSGGGMRTSDPLYFARHVNSDHGNYTVHLRQRPDDLERFDVEVTVDLGSGKSGS